MTVDVPNEYLLHAEEEGSDMYATIDLCCAEMDKQLKKYKEKFQARKREAQKTRREMKSVLSVQED
jgi:ribosomal subunit interface protein